MVDRTSAMGYPAQLDPEPEGGFTVTFPDIGYGVTYGKNREEALVQAEDMLEEAVLGPMAHDEEVPPPTAAKGRPVVFLPPLTAARLEVYRAMRSAGIGREELAERLGWSATAVKRIFDGYHACRLDQLEKAAAALGRRLIVTSRAA